MMQSTHNKLIQTDCQKCRDFCKKRKKSRHFRQLLMRALDALLKIKRS